MKAKSSVFVAVCAGLAALCAREFARARTHPSAPGGRLAPKAARPRSLRFSQPSSTRPRVQAGGRGILYLDGLGVKMTNFALATHQRDGCKSPATRVTHHLAIPPRPSTYVWNPSAFPGKMRFLVKRDGWGRGGATHNSFSPFFSAIVLSKNQAFPLGFWWFSRKKDPRKESGSYP